ncbi:Hypothetical_protein [Hexamita inflata]|uniref:Hypothetical_protein n=1 Tax=Hexamita inflata TaxID=28002 RepID=A0AA86NG90_9EUKA|nr:Hypothetical protein HINF_LOCUS6987 [Hexamita inflata]
MYYCKLQSSLNNLELKHKQSSNLLQTIKIHPSLGEICECDTRQNSANLTVPTFHDQLEPSFQFANFRDKLDQLEMSMEDVEVVMDEEDDSVPFPQFKIGSLISLF